jgi:ADP-ribose pyrophosphatase
MSDIKPWVIVQRSKVLSTRVFDVQEHIATSQEDDSLTGKFYLLDCPNWVNVIAMTPDKQVVLIRQYRHGLEDLTIEIPGGMVDGDEAYVTAGLRELKEETGYVGESARCIGMVAPNPAIQNNRCATLLVENCRPVSHADLDEHEEIEVWTEPLDDVLQRIRNGEITHALVIAAFQHLALLDA